MLNNPLSKERLTSIDEMIEERRKVFSYGSAYGPQQEVVGGCIMLVRFGVLLQQRRTQQLKSIAPTVILMLLDSTSSRSHRGPIPTAAAVVKRVRDRLSRSINNRLLKKPSTVSAHNQSAH